MGIAEKGSPCARRLGVATDTTGVVRVWATWAPAAKRWAFCQKSTHELLAAQTRREQTHAYHHARMTSFIDVCSDMLGMTMCMRLDRSWVKVNRGDLPSWGSWWRDLVFQCHRETYYIKGSLSVRQNYLRVRVYFKILYYWVFYYWVLLLLSATSSGDMTARQTESNVQ